MIYAIIMVPYHISNIMSYTLEIFPNTTYIRAEPLQHPRPSPSVGVNNSQLLDVASECLKVLHPRRTRGSVSEYVVTSHISCLFQIFFIFNAGVTIFIVPQRALRKPIL